MSCHAVGGAGIDNKLRSLTMKVESRSNNVGTFTRRNTRLFSSGIAATKRTPCRNMIVSIGLLGQSETQEHGSRNSRQQGQRQWRQPSSACASSPRGRARCKPGRQWPQSPPASRSPSALAQIEEQKDRDRIGCVSALVVQSSGRSGFQHISGCQLMPGPL